MNIAIIPARGGSSRVPYKNIKNFLGKPMIAYSIEAALQSGVIDKVIVSTDSPEIADIACQWGAEVPFLRPLELGQNHINVADVVHHALNELIKQSLSIDSTCCLVATAPMLKPEYIRQGFEILSANDVDSVVSVKRFSFPILRAFKKNEQGRLKFMWPEHELTHSQYLPEAYHDAAQFYWLNTKRFLISKSLMGKEVLPVILPDYLVKDIDTMEDWESAEVMYQVCRAKNML